MEPRDKQIIDAMAEDIARLKRIVHILERRVKQLEKENIRIKHDQRGVKMSIASRQS